jgi:TonB family protein
MLKSVLKLETGRLIERYNPLLSAEPGLAGSWRLEFTVNPDGTVADVRATGSERAHAALEACIVERMRKWRFSPIAYPQAVATTLTFRPTAPSPAEMPP